jgi:ATP synthase protein I
MTPDAFRVLRKITNNLFSLNRPLTTPLRWVIHVYIVPEKSTLRCPAWEWPICYNVAMEQQKTEQDNIRNTFSAWALAWELGFQIAIPLVVFALAGRYADRALGTSPWLLVAGVVLAAGFTSYLVYRKVANLLK